MINQQFHDDKKYKLGNVETSNDENPKNKVEEFSVHQ